MSVLQDNIAFVIADLGGGGAQKVMSVVANYCVSQGKNVSVITLSGKEEDQWPLNDKITRISLQKVGGSPHLFAGIVNNIKRIFALRRALKETQASTVVSFLTTTNILTTIASLGLGKSLTVCERNDPTKQKHSKIWEFLRNISYPLANKVTVNSQVAYRCFAKGVLKNKLSYLPNPLAIPKGSYKREKVFLAVGRLHHQKAYDVLLKAWSKSGVGKKGWRLVVLGNGALEGELKALAKELSVSKSVEWKGHVADPSLWYKKSSIFVMASRYEGVSNALLEACSYKLAPIVSSSCDGIKDYLEDGKSARFFENENSDELATLLETLAQDDKLCNSLGNSAFESIKEHFEEEKCLKEWVRLLNT